MAGPKKTSRASSTAPISALSRLEKAPPLVLVFALATLILAAYGNSLTAGFHFDDYAMLTDPYVTGPGLGWEIFRVGQTRPLTYWTFHWNYLAGGDDPQGYHWVNLLLHLANSCLVLMIARRHLAPSSAFLAAAVFAIHPLQSEAVTYIFARSTLLTTLFALLTVLFFLREKYAWSAIAFGLSLLAKEETVALPAFLLLYDFVAKRKPRVSYYAAMGGLAALAAARLFYVLHTLPDPGVGFRIKGISAFSYALTQARVIWIYLRLFVLPVGLNLDHDVPLSQSVISPLSTLLALAGLALLAGGLVWLIWKRNQPALWSLGFFLLLSPSSSIVAQADVIFEHRTYFPFFCLVIVVGYLVERWRSRPAFSIVTGALILVLTFGTIVRNRAWHDEKSLWTDIMEKSPGKARSYLGLARVYAQQDPNHSRQLLERGLQIDPNHPELHTNLGVVLMQMGDGAEALKHFERAMALTRETADHWNNIGAAHFRMGDADAAGAAYRRSLELDPCSYNSRRNLMFALAQQGKRAEAYQMGEVPPGCRMLPDHANDLADYREKMR